MPSGSPQPLQAVLCLSHDADAGLEGTEAVSYTHLIAVRSSVICSDANLPRVEYEDIVSGAGRLNKDIYTKESSKSGIAFHQGDVLYGKLRPYLQNWLLPAFDGLAVGDFWVLQPQNADSSFLYRLIQSRQFDEVANQSTGTKMPRADWKLVSKTVFSIPSNISEQAAIGTYFTALDSLITLQWLSVVAFIASSIASDFRFVRIRKEAKANITENPIFLSSDILAVSYTHLDVYKRQGRLRPTRYSCLPAAMESRPRPCLSRRCRLSTLTR